MAKASRNRGLARWTAAALLGIGISLSGCGSDGGFEGIEVNSKILDAAGLSGNPFKKEEPKLGARAPLVLPPNAGRLPEPGAEPQATPAALAADPAWPKDPEKQKLADAESKEQARQAHCKDGNWKEKAIKDESGPAAAEAAKCGNSLFSVMGSAITGNK